jgi:small acid-soluble spore protein E (minor gamma-type SASP)
LVKLISVEVITMTNFNQQPRRSAAGTNIQEVRQQNANSAGSGQQFGQEFASETDVQEVREQNRQAESRKGQNSGQGGSQSGR